MTNCIADTLSRYYLNKDTQAKHVYDLVSTDTRLDPEGETLTENRIIELRIGRILDKKELCKVEAQVLVQHLHPAVSENIGESSMNNSAAIESMGQGPALNAVLLTKSKF